MKTYEQRAKDIQAKVTTKRRQRRTILAVTSLCCCLLLVTGLFLLPKNKNTSQPEYDPLIQVLQQLAPKGEVLTGGINSRPEVDNATLGGIPEVAPDSPMEGVVAPDAAPDGGYEEITDNQVQGVTEADLIKRSDRYIYYLRNDSLSIYSIEGEASTCLGTYPLKERYEDCRIYPYNREMYLSLDCSTITIISDAYNESTHTKLIRVQSLDVTNPEDISESGTTYLTGNYKTSRLIGNNLYLFSDLYVQGDVDYEKPETFLPCYGTPDNMTYLSMEDILLPDAPTLAMYTVISKLDLKSLAMQDTLALLSYSGSIYMSNQNIFLTRGYSDSITEGETVTNRTMSEITQISFTDNQLQNKGSFSVAGSVLNQYSLDEYENTLRVVTTTSESTGIQREDGLTTSYQPISRSTNASLYCVDLSDYSIRAKVEHFAPEGESVQSARFDGTNAYVCTSIVLSDPVFFFDLKDLDNITYKDTGTIDGYSMSLVDFQNGFLMGIGYGDSFSTLKIEMYRQDASSVLPHCNNQVEGCYFSDDYKSYYIDRERQLIGLGMVKYDGGSHYLLLQFDGYELVPLVQVAMDGEPSTMRGVVIDRFLYLLGDSFQVIPLP